MKIKVKKTTEKEIEFELPYYTKTISHMFKFIDEHTILVIHSGFEYKSFSIEKLDMDIPETWLNSKKVTKEEFEKEYKKVLKLIQNEIK